jgi:hypothetical protein
MILNEASGMTAGLISEIEAMIIMVEKNTPLETCLHALSIMFMRTSSGILVYGFFNCMF